MGQLRIYPIGTHCRGPVFTGQIRREPQLESRYHYRSKICRLRNSWIVSSSELGNDPSSLFEASRHIPNGGKQCLANCTQAI